MYFESMFLMLLSLGMFLYFESARLYFETVLWYFESIPL